ncbi:hypothetical protein B2J93_837 [Marssonina coronariae]|uniref:Uncharacterized protein n=1 Tax=Diplocarpon coronariae TaxID=2795749 RepID=A0A218ZCD2_9HELO|nr:hypothetical protein B2J93_837 [Marssonina coronariae]
MRAAGVFNYKTYFRAWCYAGDDALSSIGVFPAAYRDRVPNEESRQRGREREGEREREERRGEEAADSGVVVALRTELPPITSGAFGWQPTLQPKGQPKGQPRAPRLSLAFEGETWWLLTSPRLVAVQKPQRVAVAEGTSCRERPAALGTRFVGRANCVTRLTGLTRAPPASSAPDDQWGA